MANLKEIKNRRSSVQTTMQVTRAMQMIASNNLRKAQERVSLAETSFSVLDNVFADLTSCVNGLDILSSQYTAKKSDTKRVLLVFVSSNRGLCGVFNSNVFRKVLTYLEDQSSSYDADVSFLTIGKKGVTFLEARDIPIFRDHSEVYDAFDVEKSASISKTLMKIFLEGHFDSIKIAYTHFFGVSNQQVILDDFLPFIPSVDTTSHAEVICEPDANLLYKFLVPEILTAKVYKSLSHSIASEHISRMIAMQKATENAEQLSSELNLMYNKLRQASVTNELLEIISGTNSLNG